MTSNMINLIRRSKRMNCRWVRGSSGCDHAMAVPKWVYSWNGILDCYKFRVFTIFLQTCRELISRLLRSFFFCSRGWVILLVTSRFDKFPCKKLSSGIGTRMGEFRVKFHVNGSNISLAVVNITLLAGSVENFQ